jgi:hypothetical protein
LIKLKSITNNLAEMKKLGYLLGAVIMVTALFSCEQDENEIVLKKADTGTTVTTAPTVTGVSPVIIPGANNGGNRTCAEVAAAFGLPAGYFLCGEKIDYSDGQFIGEFPDGLMVVVQDGKYVSFNMEEPVTVGDKKYVVGAVIVKGGNAANVYYYPGGVMEDSGLVSPVNSSGKPAGLSNLTFCLIEQKEELVIAMKTYLAKPVAGDPVTYTRKVAWAVSDGMGVDLTPGTLHIGYNYYNYNGENRFQLMEATLPAIVGPIGMIKVDDYWEGDAHYLRVVVDLSNENLVFDDSYLYVGSYAGYENRYYTSFPFKAIDSIAEQRVFIINFNDILL